MKILYFSCHEILEYDDLKMFIAAGHDIFSLGAFTFEKEAKGCVFRRPLPEFFDRDLEIAFLETKCSMPNKTVTREFARLFDVAIINHYPEWVQANLDALKDIPIIVRTIGQSRVSVEQKYKDFGDSVYVVRYSPTEQGLPGFAKTDATIYFSKDRDGYLPWTGRGHGLSFHNHFASRDVIGMPKLADWHQVNKVAPIRLFGAGNEQLGDCRGLASPDEVASIMADASYYFYIYTYPPSYTLSLLEAMTAGVPVVAPSSRLVESGRIDTFAGEQLLWSPQRYEVPFILDGVGLTYDSVQEAADLATKLSRDHLFASSLSQSAQRRAIELFSPAHIASEWGAFLDKIC